MTELTILIRTTTGSVDDGFTRKVVRIYPDLNAFSRNELAEALAKMATAFAPRLPRNQEEKDVRS